MHAKRMFRSSIQQTNVSFSPSGEHLCYTTCEMLVKIMGIKI